MQTCKRCVLDERFPDIRFEADGVCSFCHASKDPAERAEIARGLREKFERLLAEHRGFGGYDCLVAYSGGKDSTYLLHVLKERYDLRILAVSVDNWFQSDRAKANISAVLKSINVDHLTVTPSYRAMRELIVAAANGTKHSPKALTRASAICTSCISLIRFIGFRLAVEQNIPFLVFGMSPGQAPLSTAVVKVRAPMVRAMQAAFLNALPETVADMFVPMLLTERHFAMTDSFPHSVNLLALVDYDEETVYRLAELHGWRKPDDTDANSTNCLLNAFANKTHIDKFGINPYAHEVAELVRLGCLTRDEGLKKLAQPLPEDQVAAVREQLGV